ncbi:MAG: hypothetical protein HFI86_05680 [Bacilli bacterium]|nr:hypothetical protein [Bacilli bacterium]
MATAVEKKEINTLNESIIKIRVDLQNSKIKKSGKNKYAGFDYYELADFLPKLNELMLQYGINDKFTIEEDKATLILIKGEETQTYNIPFERFETPLVNRKDKAGNYVKDKNGEYIQIPSMQDIQYLGALNTYYKRYLYLNAFGITDGEVIDSMDNGDIQKGKKNTKSTKKESQQQDTPTIDYKTTLLNKLKELNVNVNEYAKEHKLNPKTTQEEAKILLEELEKGVLE